STPPSSRAQRDTPASTWSSRVTSIATAIPRSSRAAASAPFTLMSATQTFAPSREKVCAMASPRPLAAPVTRATLPSSRMKSSFAAPPYLALDTRRVVGRADHGGRAASSRGVAIVPRIPRARPRGPLRGGGRDPRDPRAERRREDDALQLPLRISRADRGHGRALRRNDHGRTSARRRPPRALALVPDQQRFRDADRVGEPGRRAAGAHQSSGEVLGT